MNKQGNMYPNTKTYNSFLGCRFGCVYCSRSFGRVVRRVSYRNNCNWCYDYLPHTHPERIGKIPSSPIVFVFGQGDISFCQPEFVWKTFDSIDRHKPRIKKTYYFQSKNPQCFNQYLDWFKENQDKVVLLTTLETNKTEGYERVSNAPKPDIRFKDFYDLDYPRKAVTIEPVLIFDLIDFLWWFIQLRDQGTLEYVWFGFDSKGCCLPEPSEELAQIFVNRLVLNGIEVRGKTLRGVSLHTSVTKVIDE